MDSHDDITKRLDPKTNADLELSFIGHSFDLRSDNYQYRRHIRDWFDRVFMYADFGNEFAKSCASGLAKEMSSLMNWPCRAIVAYAERVGRITPSEGSGTPLSRDAEIKQVYEILDVVAKDSLCDRGRRLKQLRKEVLNCRRISVESFAGFAMRFYEAASEYMTYAKLRPNPRIELELVWTMLENAKMDPDTYRRVVTELSRKAVEKLSTPIMSVETKKMQDVKDSSAALPLALSELKNFVASGGELCRKDLMDKISSIEKLSDELTRETDSIHVPKMRAHEVENTEFIISLQQAVLTLSDPKIASNQAAPQVSAAPDVLSDAWNVLDKNVDIMDLWNRIVASKDGVIDQRTRTRFLLFVQKICESKVNSSNTGNGGRIRKRRRRR